MQPYSIQLQWVAYTRKKGQPRRYSSVSRNCILSKLDKLGKIRWAVSVGQLRSPFPRKGSGLRHRVDRDFETTVKQSSGNGRMWNPRHGEAKALGFICRWVELSREREGEREWCKVSGIAGRGWRQAGQPSSSVAGVHSGLLTPRRWDQPLTTQDNLTSLYENFSCGRKKFLFGVSEVDPAVGIWCFLAAVRVSVRRILRKAEVAFAVQPGTPSAQWPAALSALFIVIAVSSWFSVQYKEGTNDDEDWESSQWQVCLVPNHPNDRNSLTCVFRLEQNSNGVHLGCIQSWLV